MSRRYIILGQHGEADEWREQRGLSHRDVIVVSPRGRARALRGLGGDFEVVRFESWAQASPELATAVERGLELARASAVFTGERECRGAPLAPGVVDDGLHCECWHDGDACCRCKAPAEESGLPL